MNCVNPQRQFGISLIEVLVAIVILAFGLLGLAGLQLKVQSSEMESFQRAQALLLAQDMANRISANRVNAASYVSDSELGTGDSQPGICTTLTGAARDICEWSNELKGAAETNANTQAKIGAMIGARGCVELVSGSSPSVYRVSVVWQGITKLKAPSLTCGKNSGAYGDDTYRRAIAILIPVADLTAS